MSSLQSNSCACVAGSFSSPGDVFCFEVLHCSQMNGHMESQGCRWGVGWGGGGGPLDMLKDTCGASRGLCVMDRVPLQVAVISLSRGEGPWGQILCVCVCGFVGSLSVFSFYLCHHFESWLHGSVCAVFLPLFPYHPLK